MKLNILIFEDEKPAQNRLIQLLDESKIDYKLLATIESVADGINWFQQHALPDLIFMDIQLDDGLSFELFDFFPIRVPIIFTTAYDEYAIKAFKFNSIDYLLKPFDLEEIKRSVSKFQELYVHHNSEVMQVDYTRLLQYLRKDEEQYKERFLVKVGAKYKPVMMQHVLYFYIEDNAVYLHKNDNREYALDFTITRLETMLNPTQFFRINRKYLINISAISEMVPYSSNRLKILLHQGSKDDMVVSRDRMQAFREWIS